jgi:signal transduction histidine kinase/CheY-like chemotaxis protein
MTVLTFGIGLAPPVIAVWILLRPPPKLDGIVVMALAVNLLVLVLRMSRSLPFPIKAGIAVGALYLFGVATVFRVGYAGAPMLLMATAVVMAAVLVGRGPAAALLVGGVLCLWVAGWLISEGAVAPPRPDDARLTLFANWLRMGFSFALLAGILSVTVSFTLRLARDSYMAAAQTAARLEAETRQRAALEAERTRADLALREAQKLEALGRLAGGVAHDFNNALLVIMGWADLLRRSPGHRELEEGLDSISRAATQATQLTRQLVSFARRDVRNPRVLDANAIVDGTARSLKRLLSADIQVRFEPGEVPPVLADEGQVSQVLLNLAVNARDAMPEGGQLRLATRLAAPGRLPPQAPDPEKSYVEIVVEDTGTGMDEATLARLFEPFFTTKEPGRGTGLGLATVYGIVAQSGGYVTVSSAAGKGSTFVVAFPITAGALPGAEPEPPSFSRRPSVRVLLAEDDPEVRQVILSALERVGHEVLVTKDGDEALVAARRFPAEIDLLVTDGVMPGLRTSALIDEFRKLQPNGAVLVCSGHIEDELVRRGIAELTLDYLPKPFTMAQLLTKVSDVLAKTCGAPTTRLPVA